MNAKITIICYKFKKLADGTFPIMVRITENGKRTLKSLGISIKSEHWDSKNSLPKKNCPNRTQILDVVIRAKREIEEIMLANNGSEGIKKYRSVFELKSQPRIVAETVENFYNKLVDSLLSAGKIGNCDAYKSSYLHLKKLNKNKPLLYSFDHIDAQFLIKFEHYLTSLGIKDITIHFHFRTLRAVYNRAIYAGLVEEGESPFKRFKISKFSTETQKRALSKEEVMKLIEFDSSTSGQKCQFAQDIFAFSYFCGGISFADIAYLTVLNIEGGRLRYKRQKTGGAISIKLTDQALKIIATYEAHREKGVYLFPILHKTTHKTPLQRHRRIHKVCREVNVELRALGESLNLSLPVTTYVARHSFATVLKKSGVNVMLISEALGHKDLKTTAIYLGKFDNEQIDEAMEALL